MKKLVQLFFTLSLLGISSAINSASIFAANSKVDPQSNLMNDLMIVDYWNNRLNDRMPVTYNHLLCGGYFSMPSARMGCEGEMGVGYGYVPPYRIWSARFQMTDRLEVTGNYRVFSGIDDPVLSQHGFGDFSDKGANFKLSLFHPEDSNYKLPGLAIGMEDFMGTRAFNAQYIVLTHVFIEEGLEASLGYGGGRINGFFGGFCWMPWRKSCNAYLKGLSFVAEYDANKYKSKHLEPHPEGRVQKTPLNVGFKYRLWDQLDFSVSYIRGAAWAASVSTFYNFGETEGILPKIDDPMPYTAPVVNEPIGLLRPAEALAHDLIYAFREQGIDILQVWLSFGDTGEKILRLRVINEVYRSENEFIDRLDHLIAFLTPNDVDFVIVTIDCEGFPIQEYHYRMEFVRSYAEKAMGPYELGILSPICEATYPNEYTDWLLFKKNRDLLDWDILPKNYTYFGSSTGKFKYALGVQGIFSGYLWNDIYYSVALGWIGMNNISDIRDMDRLNPSQLLNVRTTIIRYYQQKGVTLDEAYLQKTWNMGNGFYSRLTAGYFEVEYGGGAAEVLYYPVGSDWAVSLEGAIVKKREVGSWFGVTNKIRKLDGFIPTFHKFTGSQYFLNLYYEWRNAKLDFRLKIGKFLANDYGIRYELSRYFPSGLRITFWYTYTNGHDKINGQTYYDKGFAFTMPLDIFYTHSDRAQWGYGMSAWLRDVGASAFTGQELYYLINDQRE